MEYLSSFFQRIIYTLPSVIIALSFHEWGHAFAAYKMGDPTARNLGRLTLNPLKHIDPMGMLMMLVVGFGWAKPVPVNPNNYRNYKKGEIVVSLAGVTMNLLLAFVGMTVFSIVVKTAGASEVALNDRLQIVLRLLYYFIWINLCLMVFNLIPVYPLDGFHVAEVLLSKPLGTKPFMWLRQYGRYLLIGLLLFGRFSGFSPVGFLAGKVLDLLAALFSWMFESPLISALLG